MSSHDLRLTPYYGEEIEKAFANDTEESLSICCKNPEWSTDKASRRLMGRKICTLSLDDIAENIDIEVLLSNVHGKHPDLMKSNRIKRFYLNAICRAKEESCPRLLLLCLSILWKGKEQIDSYLQKNETEIQTQEIFTAYCKLQEQGISVLNANTSSPYCNFNKQGFKGLKALKKFCKNEKLSKLTADLSFSSSLTKALHALAENNQLFSGLVIEDRQLKKGTSTALSEFLKKSTITHLDLRACTFTDNEKRACVVSEIAAKRLHYLNLYQVPLESSSIALCKHLEKMDQLSYLDLSWTELSENAIPPLLTFAAQQSPERTLILTRHEISKLQRRELKQIKADGCELLLLKDDTIQAKTADIQKLGPYYISKKPKIYENGAMRPASERDLALIQIALEKNYPLLQGVEDYYFTKTNNKTALYGVNLADQTISLENCILFYDPFLCIILATKETGYWDDRYEMPEQHPFIYIKEDPSGQLPNTIFELLQINDLDEETMKSESL